MCTAKILEEYVEAKELAKKFKAREAELKAKILEGMGGSESINKGNFTAKISKSIRQNVSESKLKEVYPEIFNELKTETHVTTLRVKKV